MRILGELWRAEIPAETMYLDNPKVAKQLDFAFDNGIPLIMFLGEDEIAKGVVKVKSLNERKEYLIERPQMIEKVRELMVQNPFLRSQDDIAAEAGNPSSSSSGPQLPIGEKLEQMEQ